MNLAVAMQDPNELKSTRGHWDMDLKWWLGYKGDESHSCYVVLAMGSYKEHESHCDTDNPRAGFVQPGGQRLGCAPEHADPKIRNIGRSGWRDFRRPRGRRRRRRRESARWMTNRLYRNIGGSARGWLRTRCPSGVRRRRTLTSGTPIRERGDQSGPAEAFRKFGDKIRFG